MRSEATDNLINSLTFMKQASNSLDIATGWLPEGRYCTRKYMPQLDKMQADMRDLISRLSQAIVDNTEKTP